MSGHRQIQVGPAMQIIDPEHGDITTDVARELAKLRQQREQEVFAAAQRRQIHIAKTCGQESRIMKGEGGMRLVAQIDEGVFNYWEGREGRDFWKHELKYMLKRHPELGVRPKADNLTVGFSGSGKTPNTERRTLNTERIGPRGKRGRWAA